MLEAMGLHLVKRCRKRRLLVSIIFFVSVCSYLLYMVFACCQDVVQTHSVEAQRRLEFNAAEGTGFERDSAIQQERRHDPKGQLGMDTRVYSDENDENGQKWPEEDDEEDTDRDFEKYDDNDERREHERDHIVINNVGPSNGTNKILTMSRKLPQAIIIGVKKCGTRALLEFMRLHPDVRASGPEVHFFDRYYNLGLDWYRQQMPMTIDGQVTLEKTPGYFIAPDVPRRIYNMSKDVKLLVVVRDPVTRAISDYTQTASKRETKEFEKLAFVRNASGVVDTSWGAIRIGAYAKHFERWLQYFPRSTFHFINGEELIRNPAMELMKVQSFLDLRTTISEKNFYYNQTKGFPCLKREDNTNAHCLGKTKGRTHPAIEPSIVKRLRDFYRPFNAKFYQLTGVNFHWDDGTYDFR
ncbi:heparan sulfate glucosamine 3-O-sulfotransferase 6-like [Glandiceps talaboti]